MVLFDLTHIFADSKHVHMSTCVRKYMKVVVLRQMNGQEAQK